MAECLYTPRAARYRRHPLEMLLLATRALELSLPVFAEGIRPAPQPGSGLLGLCYEPGSASAIQCRCVPLEHA